MSLAQHLETWVGQWPPAGPGLQVIAARVRETDGWDGVVRPVMAVTRPGDGIMGVAPRWAEDVGRVLDGRHPSEIAQAWRERPADLFPGQQLGGGVFRSSDTAPSTLDQPDAGEWVARNDPRVPAWLRPFNDAHVLIAWDDDGNYGAGVGIKVHDRFGAEVAVVTEPALRGRGLARRLVAQAMRRVVERDQVVVYLHGQDNSASARVADSVGLPDLGWRVWGLFPEAPTTD